MNGKTDSVSMMSYGFDPYLSSWSPYHGAVYAVTESVAKIVAAGGDYRKIRFTFQEYFRRMTEDPNQLGRSRLRRFWALMTHSWASVCPPSAERTVCPEPSRISMFRRPWFPLRWIWRTEKDDHHAGTEEPREIYLVWLKLAKDAYDLPVYAAGNGTVRKR